MNFIASEDDFVGANSYVSLAFANDIIQSMKGYSAWSDLSDEIKKSVLIRSSSLIDSTFRYVGEKTNVSQLLEFPRRGGEFIPFAVKSACALIAVRIVNNKAFDGVVSESAGKFSYDFKEEHGIGGEAFQMLGSLRKMTVSIKCR